MDCTVLDSLNCCPDDGKTAVVDSCCSDGTYAAFAVNSSIHVYYVPNMALPVLELSSRLLRQHPTAALAIQSGILGGRSLPTEQTQTLLAAANANGLFIWVLEEAYAASADGTPAPPPLRLISEGSSGPAEAVALSSDGLAAVGDGNCVLIWDLHSLETLLRLENHQSTVTALTFNPDNPDHLISAAEDRTFNVWNIAEGQLLYQSTIFGAALPVCMAVESQRLVLGCADGIIRQYDLTLLPVLRELQVLDASKHMQQIAAAAAAQAALHKQQSGPRTITAATTTGLAALRKQVEQLTTLSVGAGQQSGNQAQQGLELAAVAQGSGCILGLQFVQRSGSNSRGSSTRGSYSMPGQDLMDELLKAAPQLLVCTRRGLMLFNLGSGEVVQCYLFGQEAADVIDVIEEARSSDASSKRSNTPISQLQQPSDQQQQQQQRWLSCCKALPNVDQPAAACCFAWLQQREDDQPQQQQQQRRGAQLLCCVASGFSSRIGLLQLAPARQKAGWGLSAAAATALGKGSSWGTLQQKQQQQLSVFQTQPLPAGSPLLAKTSKASSGSSNSPIKGLTTSTRRSSGGSSTGSDSGNALGASTSSSGRATWARPLPAAAAAAARAGSLNRAALPSVVSEPKSSSKGQLAEKPVTFHKKIKSSGYGFVQPKMKLGQVKPAPIKVGLQKYKGPQLLAHQLAAEKQYPMDSGPPITLLPQQTLPSDAPVHGGGVLQVEFAADGCRLLTGSTDRTARCLWLPLSKHAGAGTTFVGHNGPVNSVCWSHDGEYLLTASSDRTACLWSSSLPSPLITFNSVTQTSSGSSTNGARTIRKTSSTGSSSSSSTASSSVPRSNSSTGKGSSSSSAAGSSGRSASATGTSSSSSSSSGGVSGEFIGEVTAARFFYMDEVVLLATGNKVHMFRYKPPDTTGDDDIQRLKAVGSYILAASFNSNCQSVLDIAAANSFLSTLLLLACSNRSIELVDAATMQVALTIPDAHSRPVQRLVQPAASPFVSHTREIHELFASTAPDGVLKLWDVRSGSCVRSFTGHKHSSSQVPIGAAFSPCMRYLATGSEDKSACIYDLRSTTLLHKLRQPRQADVVADVAFHPYKPWLVVGLMNGRLQWYGDVCNRAQHQRLPGGMADRQVEDRQVEDDFL